MGFPKPSAEPPKQGEMQYFPRMTTTIPLKSGEFRRVLHTGLYSQLVLMAVPVRGDIGEEAHPVDHSMTFTSGTGLVQMGEKEQEVRAGDMVVVPAGTKYQLLNIGSTPLTLYTIYAPAEHEPTTVHQSKEDFLKAVEEGRNEPPAWSQRGKEENEKEGIVKTD